MAVFPGAVYRPLNQFSNQGTKPRVGVVLHVNDSDGPSLYNWIATGHNMSCHWQVAKDGTIEQYIDTDNGSWCQMDGNDTYLSIETQGFPNEPLTDLQVKACADIMRWVHATHGIPLQIADTVGAPGLGWHGMGGAAWGGHPGCPGDFRKAQRSDILKIANPIVPIGPTVKEDSDMFLILNADYQSSGIWLSGGVGMTSNDNTARKEFIAKHPDNVLHWPQAEFGRAMQTFVK